MRLAPLRRLSSMTLIIAGVLILAACRNAGSGSVPPSTAANSAAPSSAGGALTLTIAHTSAGDAIAGPNGMTLYVFANDTNGSSTCSGGCATKWPPLVGDGSQVDPAAGISGEFGTTTRDDGTKQVTHNGQPLYYYSGDSAAGDAKGEGVGGVWHIAPVGAASASQGASASYGAPGY